MFESLHPMPSVALIRAEFLRSLRSGRPYLFLMLLLLVGWLIVWASYPAGDQQLAMLGRAAEEILLIYTMVVLISAGLFVPALAATAIVSEREQETYDQLSLTLIPAKGMIAAKFLNAVGLYLAVVIGSIPVLGTVFFMVGLDIRLVLLYIAILLMGILSTAAIGLAASAYARRSLEALVIAYLSTLFFMGGHDFLLILADEGLGIDIIPVNSNSFMVFAMATCPPITLAGIYDTWGGMRGFYWACCYHAAIVAVCFALTILFVRRGPRRAFVETARTRWLPWHGRRFRPIGDRVNAMTVKELRSGLFRRKRNKALLWLASLTIFITINSFIISDYNVYGNWPNDMQLREAVLLSFLFFMGIFLPAIPVAVTNLLTKEHEMHSMDMLRVTLLSPRQLVFGKMQAGLRTLAPIMSSFAIAELLFAIPLFGREQEYIIFTGIITAAVSAFFILGLAAFTGAAARRTSTALVAAFGLGLGTFLGLPLLGVVLCESMHMPPLDSEKLVAAFSPVISYVVHIGSRQDDEFMLWFLVMMSYSGLGTYLVVKATHRYARLDD